MDGGLMIERLWRRAIRSSHEDYFAGEQVDKDDTITEVWEE